MSIFMSIKRCGSIWVWCDLRYHTIRSDMRNTFIVAMISHWVPFRRDRVSHNSICNGTIGQVRQHVLSINIVCQGHPEKKNSDSSILTHVPGIPSDQNIVFSTLYSQLPISSEHKFMSIIARVCNFGVWEEFPFCLVSVITRVRSTKLCWQDLKKMSVLQLNLSLTATLRTKKLSWSSEVAIVGLFAKKSGHCRQVAVV